MTARQCCADIHAPLESDKGCPPPPPGGAKPTMAYMKSHTQFQSDCMAVTYILL